jgi:hypothetical protein
MEHLTLTSSKEEVIPKDTTMELESPTENLFMVVVRFMNLAETMHAASSYDKKQFVVTALEVHLGSTLFTRFSPILDVMIDGIVSMTRKEVAILLNQTKHCILSCFR